jgi:hypothetical protein
LQNKIIFIIFFLLTNFKKIMKTLLLSFIMFLSALNLSAQPATITYQGVLTDDEGRTITGDRNLTFTIYNAETNGNELWTETHSSVSVNKGLFELELGSVTSFGALDFSQELWLEVKVGTTTLTPRIAFNSVSFAQAGNATSLKITTGAGEGKVLTSDADGDAVWSDDGLQYFSETRDNSSPNDTKPAHQLVANGTEDNIDFVISPKGDGAILAQIPDGTATGGDKRGRNSIDLQMSRDNQTQVASGHNSFIGAGQNNKASGNKSFVGTGISNNAGGIKSFIGSGEDNNAIGLNSSVVSGVDNTATGESSFVGGGEYNNSSGDFSAVVAGYNNTASGNKSFVGNGIENIVSGYASFIGGGDDNNASGSCSVLCGGGGWGIGNNSSGNYSFVGGGSINTASGIYSSAVSGFNNTASADYSFVGGV